MELCCILMVAMVKQIHVFFFLRLVKLYRIEGWIFTVCKNALIKKFKQLF